MMTALLLACDDSTVGEAPSHEPPSHEQPSHEQPSHEQPTVDTATWPTTEAPDTEALQGSLQAAIDALPTLSMVPCFAAWQRVSGDQDSSCPTYFAREASSSTWSADCETDAGTSYAGIFTSSFDHTSYVEDHLRGPVMDRFGPEVVPGWEVGRAYVGPALDGIALDGTALVHLLGSLEADYTFGGQGVSTTVTHQGLTVRHHWVDGVCQATIEDEGTWMAADLGPSVRIQQLSAEGDDHYLTNVSGAFTGLPGAFPTVEFDNVTLRPTGLPASAEPPCDEEPSGPILLTDEEARVFVVVFDPSAACDGCGRVTSYWGEPFGTVCADFGALRRPMATTDLGAIDP